MAVSFAEVKSMIDSNIGNLTEVTVKGDSALRGASSTGSGSGLTIKRNGEVTGSLSSGSITLEGGGLGWDGALTNDAVAPNYTRAQRVMLASLTKYIESMSNATIDDQLSGK